MSKETSFAKFRQKYVTITKADNTVISCYLLVAGGVNLSYAIGDSEKNELKQINVSEIESIQERQLITTSLL